MTLFVNRQFSCYFMKSKKSFPFFLKLASYFYPVTIENSSTPYELELVLSKNKLILNSKHANQSNGSLEYAFHECFHHLGIYTKEFNNVLVLGLGLGSVVHLLNKNGNINQLTAYENNPQILAWLEKYYDSSDINIISKSANEIDTVNAIFDLILIDLFIDTQTPNFLNEISYWEKLNSITKPNGLIIWNTLVNYPPQENFNLNNFFEKGFEVQGINRMWVKKLTP